MSKRLGKVLIGDSNVSRSSIRAIVMQKVFYLVQDYGDIQHQKIVHQRSRQLNRL